MLVCFEPATIHLQVYGTMPSNDRNKQIQLQYVLEVLSRWTLYQREGTQYVHVHVPYIPHTKGMQAEVLLMNMFNVCGYVLYYGLFLHSKNHFSYAAPDPGFGYGGGGFTGGAAR